jgi:hypothetical protein
MPNSTNRSSTCYPARCKSLRSQLEGNEDLILREPKTAVVQDIRRMTSYKVSEPERTAEDVEMKFLKEAN